MNAECTYNRCRLRMMMSLTIMLSGNEALRTSILRLYLRHRGLGKFAAESAVDLSETSRLTGLLLPNRTDETTWDGCE